MEVGWQRVIIWCGVYLSSSQVGVCRPRPRKTFCSGVGGDWVVRKAGFSGRMVKVGGDGEPEV